VRIETRQGVGGVTRPCAVRRSVRDSSDGRRAEAGSTRDTARRATARRAESIAGSSPVRYTRCTARRQSGSRRSSRPRRSGRRRPARSTGTTAGRWLAAPGRARRGMTPAGCCRARTSRDSGCSAIACRTRPATARSTPTRHRCYADTLPSSGCGLAAFWPADARPGVETGGPHNHRDCCSPRIPPPSGRAAWKDCPPAGRCSRVWASWLRHTSWQA